MSNKQPPNLGQLTDNVLRYHIANFQQIANHLRDLGMQIAQDPNVEDDAKKLAMETLMAHLDSLKAGAMIMDACIEGKVFHQGTIQ